MIKTKVIYILSLLVFIGVVFLIISLPTTKINPSVQDIKSKLKGKILIQIESKGEAWYLNPNNLKRYYLDPSPTTWQLLQRLSTKIDINKWQEIKKDPQNYQGKFFLIADRKNIYYIAPDTNKIYLLNGPNSIFDLIRKTGLGISNQNLEKIPIGN